MEDVTTPSERGVSGQASQMRRPRADSRQGWPSRERHVCPCLSPREPHLGSARDPTCGACPRDLCGSTPPDTEAHGLLHLSCPWRREPRPPAGAKLGTARTIRNTGRVRGPGTASRPERLLRKVSSEHTCPLEVSSKSPGDAFHERDSRGPDPASPMWEKRGKGFNKRGRVVGHQIMLKGLPASAVGRPLAVGQASCGSSRLTLWGEGS
ncbi:hypothetical protein Cadr_000012325 [Camelus dromedarius]|uniref:Uncharacterized protein n=1 Tax=Camelus dromedarius TaxID=9838 RepID=A0A5N4DQ96_CAMDR|nr:hypothetical protein Cadr_000012325 [Camelus dromedarius]